MRILLSAYACEPGRGSEPGVGWNWARQIARSHEVWVITRVHRRDKIEKALSDEPDLKASFIYYDLPRWTTRWWKKGQRGVHLHYHLWQIGAFFVVWRLCRQVSFDYIHHITFGTYWKPSFLAMLPVPFIWGPVGGGEKAPVSFRRWFTPRGRVFESIRDLVQTAGTWDPFVRLTARRSVLALAKTEQTAAELYRLGCPLVHVMSEAGLPAEECTRLFGIPARHGGPFRILSLGRLVHWKGFELSLRAYARLRRELPDAEYWLVGDGPERERLERMAAQMEVGDKVRFFGNVPRTEVLNLLAECDVLVHPSLHDSGGWVCVEAMAAGRPVVCLDTGGPTMQVTAATGFRIRPENPPQAINGVADALAVLGRDPDLRNRMGDAARQHVARHFACDGARNRSDDIFHLLGHQTEKVGSAS
jgi:glycosyltransferase involved in cell wall biosynthesis